MAAQATAPTPTSVYNKKISLAFQKDIVKDYQGDNPAELHPVQLNAVTAKLAHWGPPSSSRLRKCSTAPQPLSRLAAPGSCASPARFSIDTPASSALVESPPSGHTVASHILTKGALARLVAFSLHQNPLDLHPALLRAPQRTLKAKQQPAPSSPLGRLSACSSASARRPLPTPTPTPTRMTCSDASTSTAPEPLASAPRRSPAPRVRSLGATSTGGPVNVYAGQVARRMLTKGRYNVTADRMEQHPRLVASRPKRLPGRSPLSRSSLAVAAEELPLFTAAGSS